jgi:AhpD family alkylhydroperoxidase
MKARINNVAMLVPGVMEALQGLSAAAGGHGLPQSTVDLVHLRASQINGCSVCCDMHSRGAKKRGEKDERLFTLAAWRDTPYFSDAERAALALTEALTRIADRPESVSDEIWNEAARHYDEAALASLVVEIAGINAWNRLNIATRQVSGEWTEKWAA